MSQQGTPGRTRVNPLALGAVQGKGATPPLVLKDGDEYVSMTTKGPGNTKPAILSGEMSQLLTARSAQKDGEAGGGEGEGERGRADARLRTPANKGSFKGATTLFRSFVLRVGRATGLTERQLPTAELQRMVEAGVVTDKLTDALNELVDAVASTAERAKHAAAPGGDAAKLGEEEKAELEEERKDSKYKLQFLESQLQLMQVEFEEADKEAETERKRARELEKRLQDEGARKGKGGNGDGDEDEDEDEEEVKSRQRSMISFLHKQVTELEMAYEEALQDAEKAEKKAKSGGSNNSNGGMGMGGGDHMDAELEMVRKHVEELQDGYDAVEDELAKQKQRSKELTTQLQQKDQEIASLRSGGMPPPPKAGIKGKGKEAAAAAAAVPASQHAEETAASIKFLQNMVDSLEQGYAEVEQEADQHRKRARDLEHKLKTAEQRLEELNAGRDRDELRKDLGLGDKQDSAYMLKFLQGQIDELAAAYEEAVAEADLSKKKAAHAHARGDGEGEGGVDESTLRFLQQQMDVLEKAFSESCAEAEAANKTAAKLKQELAEAKGKKSQVGGGGRGGGEGGGGGEDAESKEEARQALLYLQGQVDQLEKDFDEESREARKHKVQAASLAKQLKDTMEELQAARAEIARGGGGGGGGGGSHGEDDKEFATAFLTKKMEELVAGFEDERDEADRAMRDRRQLMQEKKAWEEKKGRLRNLLGAGSSAELLKQELDLDE